MAMKSLLDPLLLFEAWDHFSAALVTAIEQQVQVEEEAIALLVAPAICQALLRLITHSNPATSQYPTTLIISYYFNPSALDFRASACFVIANLDFTESFDQCDEERPH